MFEASSFSEACRPGILDLSLFGIGSSGSSSRTSQLAIVTALWFSFGVHTAAGVIGFRSRRAWCQVGERFAVRTLRASGPVELREGRIVSEKRLQLRRLRREQLDLSVEDIQLDPCASVEPSFGQA